MKHTALLLLVILASAAADSECSPPLNCTGTYYCPFIAAGPGVTVVSGEDYCSCCPVGITYLGRGELERAVGWSMALFSKQCKQPHDKPFFSVHLPLIKDVFLKRI